MTNWHPGMRESATFDLNTIHEIQRAANEGMYRIRGFGANETARSTGPPGEGFLPSSKQFGNSELRLTDRGR